MIFSELSPLIPESASITLSRMFCEKFQVNAGELSLQLGIHFGNQLLLGARPLRAVKPAPPTLLLDDRRPVFLGPQRHEELRVVVAVGVGPVVGPPDLVDDIIDLGVRSHDRAGLFGDRGLPRERGIQRAGVPNPEVALLQFRHELAPQRRQQARRASEQCRKEQHGKPTVPQADAEWLQIAVLDEANKEVVREPA